MEQDVYKDLSLKMHDISEISIRSSIFYLNIWNCYISIQYTFQLMK